VCLGVLGILGAIPYPLGVSQSQSSGPPRTASGFPALPEEANPHPDGVRFLRDSLQAANNHKMLLALNVQRYKEMNEYTAKLLMLAGELKVDTAKSDNASMSVLELRKAELIEKLAHAVHDKMKATVGNP
jgi:hypothetical protein